MAGREFKRLEGGTIVACPPSNRYSVARQIQRHICVACRKPRSTRYQECHPITLGQEPLPGICSRPGCAELKEELALSFFKTIIVQIHNHYGSSHQSETASAENNVVELAGESSIMGRPELPGDMLFLPYPQSPPRRPQRPSTGRLPTIWEDAPPVNYSRKPVLS